MDRSLTLPWLLVATPQLRDTSFQRSVVLIVEHGPSGSMGFVLNRPVQSPLVDLVQAKNVKIPASIPAWYGGPVETGTGVILHNRPHAEQSRLTTLSGVTPVGPGIVLSSTEDTLSDMIAYAQERNAELARLQEDPDTVLDGETLYPYRFLIGYSGWGAGQLSEELRQGAWIQAPARDELIFDTNWKNLWDRALATVGASPRTLVASVQAYMN